MSTKSAETAAPVRGLAPIETIRAQFPALARQQNGKPVAYFDGPGGSQLPQLVVDAMADYLLHHNANTHWSYPTSAETDAAIAGARQALADFLFECDFWRALLWSPAGPAAHANGFLRCCRRFLG